LHHHHDERCEWPPGADTIAATANLLDRRQRAREAYWDDMRGLSMRTEGIEAAIETATRVRITEDVIAAAVEVGDLAQGTKGAWRTLAAAFRAAGFEVEE
jgi:hypothetical protein